MSFKTWGVGVPDSGCAWSVHPRRRGFDPCELQCLLSSVEREHRDPE